MPINSCSINGKSGYKWGDSGKCYTHDNSPASKKIARKKALAQAVAMGDFEIMKVAEDLAEEEAMLAMSLIAIAEKYGKFNEDRHGIWAGYESPEENDVKDIGIKCENCVLYAGNGVCKIIAEQVEHEGKCRFAVIPDNLVSPEMEDEMEEEDDEEEDSMSTLVSILRELLNKEK